MQSEGGWELGVALAPGSPVPIPHGRGGNSHAKVSLGARQPWRGPHCWGPTVEQPPCSQGAAGDGAVGMEQDFVILRPFCF